MDKLTYIFPITVICFLVLLHLDYLSALRRGVPEPPEDSRRWTRRDSLAAAGLTLAYAVVAFLGLGDKYAVQRFCLFPQEGAAAEIVLDAPAEVGALRYYTGLHTGAYTVYVSENGTDYAMAGRLSQSYAEVFKWMDGTLESYDGRPVRYLRLVSNGELWLGELAVLDTQGNLLAARPRTGENGAAATAATGPATETAPGAETAEHGAATEAGTEEDAAARARGGAFAAGTVTAAHDAALLLDEQALIPPRYDYHNSTYFDEIYHARTALEHIVGVYPYEITHPPLGKLLLGLGIRLFGMTPFGWRFSGTLMGVLMLPAIYYFLKKLCGGAAVPFCGTLCLAADFMHYVQTRIATIDSYAVFFIILMYLFFWLYLRAERGEGAPGAPWLVPLGLSGLCFGLGAASKWVCIYAGGGLAVLWLLDRVERGVTLVRAGQGREYGRETAENLLWCLLLFVLVPSAVYYISYMPYGAARGMEGPGMLLRREYFDLVWSNQTAMFRYHAGVDATHPYSSVWWQWILDIRPILYYLQNPAEGVRVSFAAWVNPMLCWGGLASMLCMVWQALRWHDRTARFILIAYLAQLLPWTLVTRVVFEYHYFPSTVFLLLALCHVLRTLELRAARGRAAVYVFAGLSVGLFILFYPELRGLPVSGQFGRNFLKWLPTWPF